MIEVDAPKKANMPRINPKILSWARETAGLTPEEAAAKLVVKSARGVPGAERLLAYERGDQEPSRALLARMAKQYHRPLLTFYMSDVPRTGPRGTDFRTLPPEHSRNQDALVDALIRDLRARQEMVRAILEAEDEASQLPFVGSMTNKDGPEAVLTSIKETLALDRDRYRSRQRSDSIPTGFKYLRQQAEQAGIFVLLMGNLGSHHTNIDVEMFRGIALADNVAPFIVINDQDAEVAWSFSLLHEICHIWLGASGISGTEGSAGIERFCNEVAGRFFLSAAELAELRDISADSSSAARISDFARSRKVSSSMVAYRLYLEGLIEKDQWRALSGLFRKQWLRSREEERAKNKDRETGPSYYVVRRHRLGDALLALARRFLAEQVLTPTKAAKVLGVKPSNVFSLVSLGVGPTAKSAVKW